MAKNTETGSPPDAEPVAVADQVRDYLIAQQRTDDEVVTEERELRDEDQLRVLAIVVARNPEHAVRVYVEAETKDNTPYDVPSRLHVIAVPTIHVKTWKPKNVRMQLEIT